MTTNDVTGDRIATKPGSAEQQRKFDEGYDRIFKPRKALTQEEFTEWLKVAVKKEEE